MTTLITATTDFNPIMATPTRPNGGQGAAPASLAMALKATPFFAHLSGEELAEVAAFTTRVHFETGQFLLREGGHADRLFVIEQGRVAIAMASSPRGPIVLQSLDAPQLVGLSWLGAPQYWLFDAQALSYIQALSIQAEALDAFCTQRPATGLQLHRAMMSSVVDRLQAVRLQLLDFYGVKG